LVTFIGFLAIFLNRGVFSNPLAQVFPNWGACTPSGAFAYLKGYILG